LYFFYIKETIYNFPLGDQLGILLNNYNKYIYILHTFFWVFAFAFVFRCKLINTIFLCEKIWKCSN